MRVEEFVVARNPDTGSSLPFLVRLPLRSGHLVLKVRDTCRRCTATRPRTGRLTR